MCVDSDVAKAVGGFILMEAMTVRTGLGCGSGNEPLMDVVRLGFICSCKMMEGLNG